MAEVFMTATRFNPQDHWEPMWYRIRFRRHLFSDSFKGNPGCACIDQPHVFFSEDLTEQALAKKICASCPMLRPCTMYSLWGRFRWDDDTWGIFAGMDPDWRRRIRSGDEIFWDWTTEFDHSVNVTKAASRRREHEGIRKRDQRLAELPFCPGCGSNYDVVRMGRYKGRQRYRCKACGPYFRGEEL